MQIQEYNLFFYFITNKIECYAHSYQLLCCLTTALSLQAEGLSAPTLG